MGTRHLITIIDKNGKTKVNQYGQWDGYPSGQGKEILNYLKKINLETFQTNLSKLKKITKKQAKMVDDDPNWVQNYPYLSRDCGSKILPLIEKNQVKFVSHIKTSEAEKWCEGFYTINFKTNQFISEFHSEKATFDLDVLPTDNIYLNAFK